MKISEALDRLAEIDAARRDEGYQSQYDSPEQPGEYERLEGALVCRIGSGVFIHHGLAWYVSNSNDALLCASLVDDDDLD